MIRPMLALVLVGSALPLLARPGFAQEARCNVLCAPILLSQSGFITTNLFNPPTLQPVDTAGNPTGAPFEVDSDTDLNLRFTMVVPTELERLSLYTLFQWPINAGGASSNPFTGRTAAQLGEDELDANAPAIVYGVSFGLILPRQTRGWFAAAFNLQGIFSPAAEPDDESFYTHKFGPELYLNVAPFTGLRQGNWFRNVSLWGVLDYVATGLADEGDVVGGVRFLDGPDRWVLVYGLQIPIAPLPR